MEMLLELNPEVSGDHIDDNISVVLENDPEIFGSFSIVIASGIFTEDVLLKLSDVLWEKNVPLITCVSYGFIG